MQMFSDFGAINIYSATQEKTIYQVWTSNCPNLFCKQTNIHLLLVFWQAQAKQAYYTLVLPNAYSTLQNAGG